MIKKTASEWRVTCNPVGEEYLYCVYRLKDINDIDHSGNREIYGEYTTNEAEAEALAKKLNEED